MNKLELIIFAILVVISTLVAFDFITYALKPTSKRSLFPNRMWVFGLLTTIALVYLFMNGMKFL